MIPEAHEHLSFLMGADAITDDDLTNLGLKILERYGSASRGILVPAASLSLYSALVRERLSAGFWNEIVGRQEILFIFKLPDGTVKEVALSEATSSEIAELCSSLNGDPIEQTSNLPRYIRALAAKTGALPLLMGALAAASIAAPSERTRAWLVRSRDPLRRRDGGRIVRVCRSIRRRASLPGHG